jgi:predicted RNA-binding Zn-ribbon protein involved in translation (DUF1610 family)
MHAERIRSAGLSASARPPAFISIRHFAAVCVVCGHQHPVGARLNRATCPDCGATVCRIVGFPRDGARTQR